MPAPMRLFATWCHARSEPASPKSKRPARSPLKARYLAIDVAAESIQRGVLIDGRLVADHRDRPPHDYFPWPGLLSWPRIAPPG